MRMRADVKCYHCARVWGEWEWETQQPHYRFRARAMAEELTVDALVRLRCPRCGGPTFLDDELVAGVVPEIAQVAPRRARRRGLAWAS